MLHITNGASATKRMREGGLSGNFLHWDDVLHEGPVPEGLTLDEMREVRARFLSDYYVFANYDQISKDLQRRDEKLATFIDHEEVILWFEDDLYDQLQLLQLLDWFSKQDLSKAKLSLICPEGKYFGWMTAGEVVGLYGTQKPITEDQLRLASEAWAAFCAPDPRAWATTLNKETTALPFLSDAVARQLEEYPSVENGLSRTERQALQIIKSGMKKPYAIFMRNQSMEKRVYLGDGTFFSHLETMAKNSPPLVTTEADKTFVVPSKYPPGKEFREQELLLTEEGERVLDNHLDWLQIHEIDKWIGGVHLNGTNIWRWDNGTQQLISTQT